MTTKFKSQGFSVVEALIIVIVIALISVGGWLLYARRHDHKPNHTHSSQTASKTATSQTNIPAELISDGPQAGWKTYTNNRAGFSFSFPAQAQATSGCTQTTTVHSTTGNLIDAPTHYTFADGVASFTVVSSDNTFYVAPASTYQLTNIKSTPVSGNSYALAGNCIKVTTTPAIVQQGQNQKLDDPTYVNMSSAVSIVVAHAATPSEITSVLQNIQGTFATTSVTLATDPSGSWQNVTPQFSNGQHLGGKTIIRYYSAKQKLVVIPLGQYCHLNDPTGNCTDDQVVQSFKLQ